MADLYFCLVWVLAGFMTGLTSFGSNLIAVPLIMLVYDPHASILTGCIGAWMIFIGLTVLYRHSIFWKDAATLTLAAFTGMPLGISFLKNAAASSLLLAAGSALVLFLCWQISIRYIHTGSKPVKTFWSLPLGFISGIMMGSVGMGGPPLVIYIFLRNYNKEQTIATINAASVGIMLGVLPWQYFSGLFSPVTFNLGLTGGLCGICGIALSIPLIKKLKISLFRLLLLAMIGFSAITLLWRGFNL